MDVQFEEPVAYRPSIPVQYTPQDKEVSGEVTDIWNSDARTMDLGMAKIHAIIKVRHPDWVLSVNRIKSCLKAANLAPRSKDDQVFAKQVKSKETPGLDIASITDNQVSMVMSKARGKGLNAVRDIPQGTKLWSEKPAFLVIPLPLLRIVRQSKACAYCGRPFQIRGSLERNSTANRGPAGTTSCLHDACQARYCDNECLKLDTSHSAMWHTSEHSKIRSSDWMKFENYCLEQEWRGAYAYGVVLLACLRQEGSTEKGKGAAKHKNLLRQQYASLATVGHDVKTKANGSQEDVDRLSPMWETAYEYLATTVSKMYDLTYTEFLQGVGAYDLSSLEDCIYLLGTHLNHSCEPNIVVHFSPKRSDGIWVEALTDIKANEELRISYVNSELDVSEREEELLSWGFICGCTRCKREQKQLEIVEVDSAGHIKPPPTTERRRRKSVRFDDHTQAIAV